MMVEKVTEPLEDDVVQLEQELKLLRETSDEKTRIINRLIKRIMERRQDTQTMEDGGKEEVVINEKES